MQTSPTYILDQSSPKSVLEGQIHVRFVVYSHLDKRSYLKNLAWIWPSKTDFGDLCHRPMICMKKQHGCSLGPSILVM